MYRFCDNEAALILHPHEEPSLPRRSPRLTQHAKKNQIGARVRERRLALKLTQDAVCARLVTATDTLMDVPWIADDQEISKIENGNRTTTDLEILALARALECSACWLLLGQEPASDQVMQNRRS